MTPQTPAAPEPSSPENESSRTPSELSDEIVIPPLIVEANAAFDRDLPSMLQTHAGQWVAYRGSQRVGFNEDSDVLYQLCHDKGYAEGEFIVYCVAPICDPVVIGPTFFTSLFFAHLAEALPP